MRHVLPILIVAFAICPGTRLMAQAPVEESTNWPQFRGPLGRGISMTAKPPVKWSATENIKWKKAIPGKGSASPIVWEDKLFIVTAVSQTSPNDAPPPKRMTRADYLEKFDANKNGKFEPDEITKARAFMAERAQKSIRTQEFKVMCLDRESGDIKWEKTAVTAKPPEGHHSDHGYASATPVTDGTHLYVSFMSQGLYCYDFDGNLKWKRDDLGKMQTRGNFGAGSSLALYKDWLILPWDHEGPSRIEVINKANGETKWKSDRDEPSNWATPNVAVVDGKAQVLQSGEKFMRGYDLESGKELWRASGLSMRPVVTPLVFENLGLFSSARGKAVLRAVELNRTGDISEDGFAWKIDKQTPDIPSLLLSENRLFYISGNQGVISCADVRTGKSIFGPKRVPGLRSVYSSPVAADGKVFVTGRGGKTVVFSDDEDFNELAKNDIGEPVDATPALAGNQLFIRGQKTLFCVQSH